MTTKFDRKMFAYHGGYLTYGYGQTAKFVARFKYRNSPITMTNFRAFLIKHISVETFFAAVERGNAPLTILEAYGFTWTTSRGETYPKVRPVLK